MKKLTALGKHHVIPDEGDPGMCKCGLPKSNRHHEDVPQAPSHAEPTHPREEDDR